MTARLLVAPHRLAAGALTVDGDDHAYLFRVRRLAVGDAVVVFDGGGRDAPARVVSVGAAEAVLEVGAPVARPPLCPRITVVQALIKGDRMEWCLEKLVEVGADAIVPCATERAVVKIDADRGARKTARWQAIAREAARQCGRADVPMVAAPAVLAGALEWVAADEVKLVAHPGAHDHPLLPAVQATARSVAVLVGPEGGLAPAELDRLIAAGFQPVSLGPYTLRAETAGVVAVAALRAGFARGATQAV